MFMEIWNRYSLRIRIVTRIGHCSSNQLAIRIPDVSNWKQPAVAHSSIASATILQRQIRERSTNFLAFGGEESLAYWLINRQ